MRIRCRHCQKVMEFSEFMAYVSMYVLQGVTEYGKALILKALECYFLTQTRGWMDTHMATYANIQFKIACTECKKADCWEAFPEVIEQEVHKADNQRTL